MKEAKIRGDLIFTVGRHEIACTIAEKLTMGFSRAKGDAAWTAYPRGHNSSLGPSGFLRATITTWLPGKRPERVETARRRFAVLAPEIAAAIDACDARLTEWERERAEQEKRRREEQARRYERQRRQEIDDKRWSRFRKRAERREERDRLLAFAADLRRRLEAEGDATVEGRPLSGSSAWAEEHAQALDPFRQGLKGLFEAVTRPDYATYG